MGLCDTSFQTRWLCSAMQPVRILVLSALFLSALRLVHLKPLVGPTLPILLVPFRLLADALAPFTALAGAISALLGLLRRDRLALVAGAISCALSARHVRSVSRPHDGLERAFGPHWRGDIERKLSSHAMSHMLPRRWTPFLQQGATPHRESDRCFWTMPGSDGRDPLPLLCNIWQPPQGRPRSGLALIYFHGGGWHQYDKGLLTGPFFRHLAAQGHVVMDAAYRLYPNTDLAGTVADAKRAVAWMKANAGRYGVDPERIVVAGGSAGGHLALMAAYAPNHTELTPEDLRGVDTSLSGVVAFYPVVDLRSYVAYNSYATTKFGPLELTSPREVVAGLLGGTPEEVPDRYDLLSPRHHVSAQCPPTLLLQGSHDHVVPLEPLRSLYRELDGAGVPVVYVEYPATEHAFDLVLPAVSPSAQAAWYDVARFLALLV
jgi:acetyl esterase/lipase